MTTNVVHYEAHAPVAEIVLNRPDKHNALSRGLIGGLTEAFLRGAEDEKVRCVLL